VAGLRYASDDRRIWGVMLLLTTATFFGRPYMQLMPVFARDILHMGAGGYGLLMGTVGAGALAGALVVGTLGRSDRKGYLLMVMTGVFGIALAGFGLSHWVFLSLPLLLITGATQTLFMSLTNTLLQLTVPEEMRGRTMALYSLIPMGFMPLGTMALGSVGDVFGVPITVAGGAVIVVAATLLAARFLPAVRSLG
jgi:MFS family permease